jgi:hypothetical protein
MTMPLVPPVASPYVFSMGELVISVANSLALEVSAIVKPYK